MDAEHYLRIKALFNSLVDLSREDRTALLARSREHGEQTRQYVENLLDSEAVVGDCTARPAFPRASRIHVSRHDAGTWIGRQVGAFVIQRELGHGGMGSVFLAKRADDSVGQQVAIKIIRPECLDENTLARFRLERQVLAVLSHPNIASLIDLGELQDGAPFVVMEFVEGVSITEFVQKEALRVDERLRLYLQVCDAVSHAHRSLIVHRDIKASNILVDSSGRARLIDFGISKPLAAYMGSVEVEDTRSEKHYFSVHNVSPEYLLGGITTIACDVYALGALLYELLAGCRPFNFEGMTSAQIEHVLVEVDPAPPSERLNRDFAVTDTEQSKKNSLSAREIRGDLDSIVLRCLRKHPKDRYESVAGLVDDLNRYLGGFPVAARRGGTMYRVRRFVRRHRLSMLVAGGFFIFACISTLTFLQQRQSTLEERTRSDQLVSLMREALVSADPDQTLGKNVTAREVFERVAVEAERTLDLDARSRSMLLAAIAEITLHIGEPQQALRLMERVDMESLDDRSRENALQTRLRVHSALGDTVSARRILVERDEGRDTSHSADRWKLLEASLDFQQGDLGRVVESSKKLGNSASSDEIRDESRLLLARAYESLDHPVDAFHIYEQLLTEQQQRLPEEHPALLRTWLALAGAQAHAGLKTDLGNPSVEALRIGEVLYGRHSLGYLDILRVRRDLFGADSDHKKQREVQSEIVLLVDELIGSDNPIATKEYFTLAEITRQVAEAKRQRALSNNRPLDAAVLQQEFDSATDIYRKVIGMAEGQLPATDYSLFKYRAAFGFHLVRSGHLNDAKVVLTEALEGVEGNAAVKEQSFFFIAEFAREICVFADSRTSEKKAKLVASMLRGRDNSRSPPAVTTMNALESVVRNLGVEVPPARQLYSRDHVFRESPIDQKKPPSH